MTTIYVDIKIYIWFSSGCHGEPDPGAEPLLGKWRYASTLSTLDSWWACQVGVRYLIVSAAEAAKFSSGIRRRLFESGCDVLAGNYWLKCWGMISHSLNLLPDLIFRPWRGFWPSWDPYPSPFCTPSIGQTSHNMDYRAIIASGNIGSFNNFNTTITDDRNQVLRWLSPLEPQRRHQHIRESRLKGTGNWIFQTSEFRRWDAKKDGSSHSVLFCHGDPGVGKTHLR